MGWQNIGESQPNCLHVRATILFFILFEFLQVVDFCFWFFVRFVLSALWEVGGVCTGTRLSLLEWSELVSI